MPPTIFHPALVTPLDKDPSDSYIYDIAPLTSSASETQPQTLVSITSTNSLYCLDAETLRAVSKMQLDMEGDGGFTALRGVNENMVVTSGRNGVVCVWDVREEGRMVGEFKRGGG